MKTLTKSLVLVVLAVLNACGTDLGPGAESVKPITAFTVSDAQTLEDVGHISCHQDLSTFDPEESCRNELRNQAFRLSAHYILIQNITRSKT